MEPELETTSPGFSLQEYLAILRRRRPIIIQAFILIAVVGVAQALMARNVYQASAKLLVDGPSYNLNTVDASNPLSSLFEMDDQQTVDTQVVVLQAQPLLDQVAKQAGPASITVTTVPETNVIEVSGESGSPQAAAAAPNTLLKLFIAQDVENRMGEMERARQFVLTQGKQAHDKLNATENALKAFKQKTHIVELSKNRDDQIALVTTLTATQQKSQSDIAGLRAEIASDQNEMNREPKDTVAKTQTTNPVVAGLHDSIRALEVQRVGLIQPGGLTAKAPQVRALDAQISALRSRLAAQPALATTLSATPNVFRVGLQEKIADLAAQIPVLQTQAAMNDADLARAKSQIGSYAGLELTLDRLTSEHDAAQAADKNFTDQLADLNLREKAHHATARIIETAQVPTEPVRPKRVQSILFACVIGLFVGLCLALLQEFLDDRINSVADADRVLQLPSLGHVPALSSADAHLLPQMKGVDPASESYRVLRTNIHFATVDAPARTLLVTSSNPGEGKTTTAANLAFAMAMDGKKVILVDTDLRRPSLHKLLDLRPMPGLTDVLLGHAALAPQEVMSGLSVLTAGSTPPNPGELLNSRKFRNLVLELTEQADMVIFDSPPILVAADAAILASQMDGTIMVVETGATKKASARRSLSLLRQARATVLGVAYNKMRSQDGPGYYAYNYQYGTPTLLTGPDERSAGLPASGSILPVPPEKESK
jgi:succinoglycan biosynthesis transport protein ExoP